MTRRGIFLVLIVALCVLWQLPASAQTQSTEELKALHSQLRQLYHQGNYAEAIPIAEKMLSLMEKIYGPDKEETAAGLNNLAELYRLIGRYAEAEPLYLRSMAILEKGFGKDDPLVADCLNSLGLLYHLTGRYAEAERFYKNAWEIREAKLGKDHPSVANSLGNLAALYMNTGRYAEAERLYKRDMEITATKLGKDHPIIAYSLNNLGTLYYVTGRYVEAERVYRRALEIREAKLPKDHPDVAISMVSLAELYRATGRYAEAEPLLKKALEIYERRLARDHPQVATALNNLAGLYQATGRYAEAESLFKRSLEIREAKLLKDHPDVAQSLSNLAGLYSVTGRYPESEAMFREVLEIYERKLGEDHPNVAVTMNNLGHLHLNTGRFAEAERFYKKSVEIREKFGKDHPPVAYPLNNLAELYLLTGRPEKAEPLFKRSLKILEETLGQDQPIVAKLRSNLALLYASTEQFTLSHQYLSGCIENDEKERENAFQLLDEKQKLSFIEKQKGPMAALLTISSRHIQKDSKALEKTLNAWLHWKGAVTEFQGRLTEACFHSGDSVRKKCNEWTDALRTLAALTSTRPEKMDLDIYRQTLAGLYQKKSDLEAELSRLSKDFALEKLVGTADIQTISSILPKDSAYLDFAVIEPYDFKQKGFEEKPHCLAFVLLPGDPPRMALVDLGDAEAIDRRIGDYHKVIQEAVNRKRPPAIDALRRHLKALYGLVMEPLLPHIQGRKQLFISPDGSLNLIPFEAFVTPEGKYLLEEHSIQYIAAGRDIVRFKDDAKAQGKALILADPDYSLGEQELIAVAKSLGLTVQEESGVLSQEAKAMTFKRLEGARNQAEEIEKILGGVTYPDKKAIQEVLFAAASPRVLHIATHGYYLPDQKITPQWGPGKETMPPDALKAYENPMLRSGIALAGANTSQRGRVSAEKVLGLRLKGTELVVLSACETGVGDVQTGEGVFGLKRAFILSGARTVVMSLWSVPSKETAELMGSFYTKWAKGMTKAEALREAKRELMKENPNPFFWGAFVMVGDPGK